MRAPDVLARVRHGHQLRMLDVSPEGALVEAAGPLRPGAYVELQVDHNDRRRSFGATVVRCDVCAISAYRGTTYRAGLSFGESCEWLCEPATHGGSDVHAECDESMAFSGDTLPAPLHEGWKARK